MQREAVSGRAPEARGLVEAHRGWVRRSDCPDIEMRLAMDNYATHKKAEVKARLPSIPDSHPLHPDLGFPG